jgi:uncharacterized protein (TIGR04255 family)
MGFPDSPRVVYRKNPLAEVTCSLRFPSILKIDSESPAAFQDAIRTDYPLYAEAPLANAQIPPNLPPEMVKFVQGLGAFGQVGRRHEFATDDRKWQITLTREALALKTTEYRRWEEFRERFLTVNDAFERLFRPASYVRVGLQYVDVIRRSALRLEGVSWAELLKPHIAGELSVPEIAEQIDSASRQVHIRIDDSETYVTIKSGIAFAEPAKEKCFLIDSDFHTHGRTEKPHVPSTLDTFNRMAGRLFRWCIHQRLHDALEPQPPGMA